jgi:hypothetical protein
MVVLEASFYTHTLLDHKVQTSPPVGGMLRSKIPVEPGRPALEQLRQIQILSLCNSNHD